ncbi:MAG: tRNA wybutosine-synthesizing protein 3 [Archaeoglobaceae archaeon]|nr:tRNA wybutosine-synthesizing protein 3 [Archaeoglobaceae archaeon]MDK2876141.1 tRNA wybutosine-synthesizing protein 3 [Archaeoglobaceae archaeon]
MWPNYKKEKIECYEKAKKEGKVDEDIIPLLDKINEKENYVTLSSCSGRIAVIDLNCFGDKKSSEFLGKWHNFAKFEEVLDCAFKCRRQGWLIQYPPILHVACKDLSSAKNLMVIANESGFRRSGIISLQNYVVEIASLERMELPVVVDGKMIVERDYLRIAVDIANEKLKKGKIKLRRLEEFITSL